MPKAKTLESGVLRVRMYRVGFGDCFLVSLPDGAGHAHVLVDCGVHPQGNLKTIADAVKDIRSETGGRLDVVIASHAHKDHISGFASSAAEFAAMTIGEVWLPWIEDAKDAQATRIRKKQLAGC
jgi:glyoxylase-like metal-dependent hydrolase (beta-lactamase superfamily II)